MSRTRKHPTAHRHIGSAICWCCSRPDLIRFKRARATGTRYRDVATAVMRVWRAVGEAWAPKLERSGRDR